MMDVRLLWQPYKYFPYERDFAKREVQAMLGCTPAEVHGGLQIRLNGNDIARLKRLTYFREAILPDGDRLIPDQAMLEASASRNGCSLSFAGLPDIAGRRQVTRYSAHGLHEYRGKFNPQVVRAVGNMLNLRQGAWVLDPFCGSGTTLLECAHIGWNAIGVDLNPLGVSISNAKLAAFHSEPEQISRAMDKLVRRLSSRGSGLQYREAWAAEQIARFAGANWTKHLAGVSYLEKWFPASVLAQFAVILEEIEDNVTVDLGPVFKVILSDLARNASFQDPGDLRIRRRKDTIVNYPLLPHFVEALGARINTVARARRVLQRSTYTQHAFVGDSRAPFDWARSLHEARYPNYFDAVIASPPYATALPYIDTQRLSLCLLGLLRPSGIAPLDRSLVGSREIGESKRREVESNLLYLSDVALPRTVIDLCRNMLGLAGRAGNGFRRRNVPALVYRYFADMARVFKNVHEVTREGGVFALVVGRNRTVLDGEPVLIDTPMLLLEVASRNGWRARDSIDMDTYPRYDVHQRNSIRAESLILLERV